MSKTIRKEKCEKDLVKNIYSVDMLTECCAPKEIWSCMCDSKSMYQILTSVNKKIEFAAFCRNLKYEVPRTLSCRL